MSQEI